MKSVGAVTEIGLIETIRARQGRVPWLAWHLERLHAAIRSLGLSQPAGDLAELIRIAAGSGDRVVRLELRAGHAEIATRDMHSTGPVGVVVSSEVHQPYPHKTTGRQQFGRALAEARRKGYDDALLLTAEGHVAEGTAWNVFWWDNGALCTPAEELGVLPGVGRRRVAELVPVREERAPLAALTGRSLFLTNAVRGIEPIRALDGMAVPPDPRTAELAAAFWP